MKDLQKMMKEAQKMAAEVQRAQAELAEVEFTGRAGGSAVEAVATGDGLVVRVTIDPDVFDDRPDADDVEMLADTVTAAVNHALSAARDAQEKAMGPLAGGMGGLGLGPGV